MAGEHDALSVIRGVGSVAELRSLAASGLAPARRPGVNAHVHLPPNFSAFASVAQAVTLAAEQGVRVLGASNYYNYEVYGDFAVEAHRQGVFPLFGLEIISLVDELVKAGVKINDPGNPGKMYICGKGITAFQKMTAEGARLLGLIRSNDSERMARMVGQLAEVFESQGLATGLDDRAVKERIVRRYGCPIGRVYLQERHVAQVFQEVLFERVGTSDRAEKLNRILGAASHAGENPVKVQNEIRSHLMKTGKRAYVPETFVSFEQARQLILEMGGIPCYPVLADGTKPTTGYESPVGSLIEHLKKAGITCVELVTNRNTPAVLREYVTAMRSAGLVVTAGTEHNSQDLIGLEPICGDGSPVAEDLKNVFWEGACVIAAHQFLVAGGEAGYVDGGGRLNSVYNDSESRIGAFAALGAAVIERYFEKSRSNKGAKA